MTHASAPPDYYDQSLKTHLLQRWYHQARFQLITRMLGQVKGDLLDVGCGGGTFTEQLARQVEGQVWGVDIDQQLAGYITKHRPKIKYQVSPAEKLNFDSQRFEVVTCLEVLEHLEQPEKALAEFHRVLKGKGRLIVLVPRNTLLFNSLWWLWIQGKGRVWQGAHVQHFHNQDLVELIERSGFKVNQKKISHLNMLLAVEARKV